VNSATHALADYERFTLCGPEQQTPAWWGAALVETQVMERVYTCDS